MASDKGKNIFVKDFDILFLCDAEVLSHRKKLAEI